MHRLVGVSAVVASAVVLGACKSSTQPPTPTTITLSSTAVTLDAIGATQSLTATVKGRNGRVLSGQTVTWTSDDTAVATVGSSGMVTAVANGTAQVTATLGSLSAKVTVTVAQFTTALSKASGDAQTGSVATALPNPLVVQASDRLNHPVEGAIINFVATLRGGTLSASVDTTGVSGQASTTWMLGTVAGALEVNVSVKGANATATFTATATAGPADSLALGAGDGQTAPADTPEADSVKALVTDAFGNPVSGAKVAFQVTQGGGSVSPDTAISGKSGYASTVWTLGALGPQGLQASATGLKGSPVLFTATASNIAVSTVSPDTMVEAGTATVSGRGFDANTANDTVIVDGVAATVTAATSTSITFTVPTYDCLPARDVTVQVSASGANATPLTHPLRPASYTTLSVGQQAITQNPDDFCLQFPSNATGGDKYLIGVGAAAEAPTVLNAFTMTGTGGVGPTSVPLSMPRAGATRAPTSTLVPSAVQQEVDRLWQRQYAAERSIRAFDETQFPTLAHQAAALRAGRSVARAPTGAPTVPNVGDTLRFRVPIFPGNACTSYTEILTRVKAVGSAGIWVSDTANAATSDSLTDAQIQAYSDTFDTKIYAADTSWFGPPSDIDNNGRVIIILTIQVNKEAGGSVAGFVFAGDLLPRTMCASSDGGEIFYGQVPDPGDASGTGARSKAAVLSQMPSLIAHEFTHDIQESRRLVLSPTAATNLPMASWEAEGQAMFAQNAVGDMVLGNSAGNNYGWTIAHTGQGQRWYGQGFDLLAAYYGFGYTSIIKNANAPEQCSLYASTSVSVACDDYAFYGAAYSFEKYVTDRYGPSYTGSVGGERGLQHDVIDKNPGETGRANWTDLLGLTSMGFDSLFSQWATMLYVDDSVPGINPALQMTSWNLANIFGPTGYGATNCGSDCQLIPTPESWGAFSQSRSVRDGSTAYTLLSSGGPHPALAIKVRDGTGLPLSTAMDPQLWVVRTH